MSDHNTHSHHTIDYVEFTVSDMDKAKRFYGEAFAWHFVDYGPAYAGVQAGGREIGGFRLEAKVSAGGPLVVLYSSSLDETLAKVVAAGGVVVKDTFAFPGGRRFHFADPSGNELAVWSER